jgi:ArsR family transcriptional regulator, lead/cadmium/zinc/bismuth-responsive transcriptional repressor
MAPKAEQLYRILKFPKHLQTTVLTLLQLGRANATDVAKLSGKARAVESAYLNQLVVMKIARKEREGRKAVFSINLGAFDW